MLIAIELYNYLCLIESIDNNETTTVAGGENLQGLTKKSYWEGTLTPRPTVDWCVVYAIAHSATSLSESVSESDSGCRFSHMRQPQTDWRRSGAERAGIWSVSLPP